MNKLNINAIALAIGLVFSVGAIAQSMTKDEYKTGKERIAADYKAGKAGCASLSANANDICVAEAKGREKVGLAELEAAYQPSQKNHYQARVARAEANHAVANERCDDLAGNAKDVCVKEAKAVETAAKADATAQLKTADANAKASEKSSEARKDATADKRDAEYAVAKEKCDTYAGTARDNCLSQAKVNFGK